MTRDWFKTAAFLMMLGVLLGAFGAHALKDRLSVGSLEIYRTAVLYQFIHALGLFVVAHAASNETYRRRAVVFAGYSFLSGIVMFSGSLYLLALTGIKGFGAFTPIGGLLFILGWAFLAFGA